MEVNKNKTGDSESYPTSQKGQNSSKSPGQEIITKEIAETTFYHMHSSGSLSWYLQIVRVSGVVYA